MHDAFEYASILERLPLVIESIASYGKGIILIVLNYLEFSFIYFHFNKSESAVSNLIATL